MKRSLLALLLLLLVYGIQAQTGNKVSLFAYSDVQLLPGMFKEAETTDLRYIMALQPDRLLAPYLREAGLAPKAESYTNWENTGLDGHIGGHYLSALAMMYAQTGDQQVLQRLNYMIDELKKCQAAAGDGYIGGVPGSQALWSAVREGDVNAIEKKWVPLYNIHKPFAGLRDAYMYTGNESAKDMLVKFADWFVNLANALTPDKMQQMLRIEHGGINEVLADVYSLTGNKKYLEAAYRFSHKAILAPLAKGEDMLNQLHANTQIPKVIGFERIGTLNNDSAYYNAARFFWETVVNNRSVAIGGNSVREHFNPADNFTTMITSEQGPETCNTYNMLKLTSLLYQSNDLVKYVDFYERAMYNHILSTQDPDKGGFVYFTPMRPGHYRVYSQPQTSMWCCVGSGIENHAKYTELIYAHDSTNLFVNLFVPSRLTWKEKGVTLSQQTRFPEAENTTLTIESAPSAAFAINIRYPAWVAQGALRVKINGKPVAVNGTPSSYLRLSRTWKKGDTIEVQLPMRTTTERLPDGLNYVAVLHGPIVLAAKTDSTHLAGLFADDSRMGHVAAGSLYPLQNMPIFVATDSVASHIIPVPGKPLTFTTKNLIYPDSFQTLKLEPFYKVQESRYVLYWQTETPESLQQHLQAIAEEEKAAAALEAITVDVVKAGEQQPEADHFMESQNSNSGINKDHHWRDAQAWFSYRMKDVKKQTAILRVTYYGGDKGRHFTILVNDHIIADVMLGDEHGDDFYTVDYAIPQDVVQQATNGVLTVKFVAAKGSVAGGIYEVRMLKKAGVL